MSKPHSFLQTQILMKLNVMALPSLKAVPTKFNPIQEYHCINIVFSTFDITIDLRSPISHTSWTKENNQPDSNSPLEIYQTEAPYSIIVERRTWGSRRKCIERERERAYVDRLKFEKAGN